MNKVFPAVKALIKEGEKFLVIKQIVGDLEVWDLPGGKVHFGESPYETLQREVKEETNLEVEIIQPLGVWWFFRKNDGDQVVCTTFVCTTKQESIDLTKNPTDENIQEFRWVTKEEFLGEEYTASDKSLKQLISQL